MSSLSPSSHHTSSVHWPYIILVAIVGAGLWLLDTHQPAPWPDAASPWSGQVRALGPAASLVDRLNTIAVTPDLRAGSALVLLMLAVSTLATLLVLDVSAWLALAVACGLIATRSAWSTISSGDDALPMALVSLVVLTVARTSPRLAAPVAAAVAALAPAAAWLAIPLALLLRADVRRRAVVALIGLFVATAVHVAGAWQAWRATSCLPPSAWTSALTDVLRPGLSADASAWIALRQAIAILTGDVHLFGLAVAAFGVAATCREHALLRRATAGAVIAAVVMVLAGVLSPATAAALFLPWWAPWFALGLAAMIARQPGRQRQVALAFALLAASATPLLRHATVVAEPWVAGSPSMAHALARTWDASTIVSSDAVTTRRLRMAGLPTVPLDRAAISRCLASGKAVTVTGPSIARVEQWGFDVADEPLRVNLGAVLDDVRRDQLVALGITPSSLAWAGPHGLTALGRVSVRRDALPTTTALGVIARTTRGGRVESGRDGVDVTARTGDVIGGRQMLAPLTVRASGSSAEIGSGQTSLAVGAHAALVVFDRTQEAVLQSVGEAAPGLPISLASHPFWRRAAISGQAHCASASEKWTALPWPAARISVPLAGTSSRAPTVLYFTTDDRPRPVVEGLTRGSRAPEWDIATFDRQEPAALARLRVARQQDGVADTSIAGQRWVVRMNLHSLGASHPDRTSIVAGAGEASWLVRLAGHPRHSWTSDVCRMSSPGERLLLGHYGAVDDDSVREITVWMGTGWHAAERLHGNVHQWSAATSATATFRVAGPRPLVLALDASSASPATGPQRLTIRVNGTPLVEDWQGAGRIAVPAALVRSGDNEIALDVLQTVQPPNDPRTLGVLVRQLRLIEAPGR